MNRVKVVMILALFLTMKATIGEGPPDRCFCSLATIPGQLCYTHGCSTGTNVHCNDGTHPIPFPVIAGAYFGSVSFLLFDYGCNCPNSTHTGTNGYYYGDPRIDPGGPFNYTTCTGFGGVGGDHDFIFGNNATDCCNFCCDRNDPYPNTTSVSGN